MSGNASRNSVSDSPVAKESGALIGASADCVSGQTVGLPLRPFLIDVKSLAGLFAEPAGFHHRGESFGSRAGIGNHIAQTARDVGRDIESHLIQQFQRTHRHAEAFERAVDPRSHFRLP